MMEDYRMHSAASKAGENDPTNLDVEEFQRDLVFPADSIEFIYPELNDDER